MKELRKVLPTPNQPPPPKKKLKKFHLLPANKVKWYTRCDMYEWEAKGLRVTQAA